MSSQPSKPALEIARELLRWMDSDNGCGRWFTFVTVQYCVKLAPAVQAMLDEDWKAPDDDLMAIVCGEQDEVAQQFKKWKAYPELDRVLGIIFEAGSVSRKRR